MMEGVEGGGGQLFLSEKCYFGWWSNLRGSWTAKSLNLEDWNRWVVVESDIIIFNILICILLYSGVHAIPISHPAHPGTLASVQPLEMPELYLNQSNWGNNEPTLCWRYCQMERQWFQSNIVVGNRLPERILWHWIRDDDGEVRWEFGKWLPEWIWLWWGLEEFKDDSISRGWRMLRRWMIKGRSTSWSWRPTLRRPSGRPLWTRWLWRSRWVLRWPCRSFGSWLAGGCSPAPWWSSTWRKTCNSSGSCSWRCWRRWRRIASTRTLHRWSAKSRCGPRGSRPWCWLPSSRLHGSWFPRWASGRPVGGKLGPGHGRWDPTAKGNQWRHDWTCRLSVYRLPWSPGVQGARWLVPWVLATCWLGFPIPSTRIYRGPPPSEHTCCIWGGLWLGRSARFSWWWGRFGAGWAVPTRHRPKRRGRTVWST